MPPSIGDVARLARVSISTVSRVINKSAAVNELTRQRVESAIRKLNYRPNVFARGLMLRRSEMLALVLPDAHGEFYSEIIRGATHQARQSGFNLVVSSAQDSEDSRGLLSAFEQRGLVDGVAVMFAELTDGVRDVLGDLSIPFVLLDDDVAGRPHDSVVIDQTAGALALMRHLVRDRGHQRVVFVGGLATNVDTIARLAAYRAVLAESGLPQFSEDVYHLDYGYETAYELARHSARQWAGPQRAVFAANDEMAAGIVLAAAELGLNIPADLAVVGFDDTRLARMTRPPLTTVRVPMAEMGARAIELLCRRVAAPDRPTERAALQPQLVVRQSCGAP